MNYFPFHIGDYAAHTAHLSLLEDLAYRRLLDLYYLRDGSLPTDVSDIARLIRMRDNVAEVESVLREFFDLSTGSWSHSRCDEEIEKFTAKSETAKKSAERRWDKKLHPTGNPVPEPVLCERNANALPTHSKSDANALPTQCEGNANQEPITNNQEPKEKKEESTQRSRGSRLAPDWVLPTDWADWARQARPDLDPKATADAFRDWWHAAPGAKGVKADWQATWRNWVRNQRPAQGRAPPRSAGERNAAFLDEWTGGLMSARPRTEPLEHRDGNPTLDLVPRPLIPR